MAGTPVPHVPISEDRLKTLVEIGLLLTSELSLDGVLQRLADHGARLIGARYAAIGVLDPTGNALESFYTSGITQEERTRIGSLPRGRGILGLLIREPRVLRLKDLQQHPESFGFPPHHPAMHSFLGAPIIGRRGVFGNIYLTERIGGGEFTDEDEELLVLLAAQAAAAVDNARLHEESARLLEEVQGLHRSRERFFSMVNHELRNALSATYGWAEMLVRKKNPESVPRAAFEVLDSAGQAVGLINDLLDLSRLDEDRLKPVFRVVDPALLARRALGRATPAAEPRNIRIELTVEGQIPSIRTDGGRVEQILVNILGNAVRHAPNDSVIAMTLQERPEGIRFRILDEGPGVPPGETESIFDIYASRADDTGTGFGVGLPLSRRLARLLGGDLRALDGVQAGGGCFELDLPIEPGTMKEIS